MPRQLRKRPSRDEHSELAGVLAQVLAPLNPVEVRKSISGRPTFYSGGKVFAFPYGNGVALKLPAPRVKELLQRDEFEPFRMKGKPVMKEWIVLNHASPKAYAADIDLFREAMAFAGGGKKQKS